MLAREKDFTGKIMYKGDLNRELIQKIKNGPLCKGINGGCNCYSNRRLTVSLRYIIDKIAANQYILAKIQQFKRT